MGGPWRTNLGEGPSRLAGGDLDTREGSSGLLEERPTSMRSDSPSNMSPAVEVTPAPSIVSEKPLHHWQAKERCQDKMVASPVLQ